jgi:hypothetical protein
MLGRVVLRASRTTFPLVRKAPPGRPFAYGAGIAFVAFALLLGAVLAPASIPPPLQVGAARCSMFAVDWLSIVMEGVPFVLGGTLAACAVRRIARPGMLAPLLVALSPGCDCAQNSFAGALRRSPPPIAGFALSWSAACGPVALLATHAVLGPRLLAARIAGGAVAALFTAALWRWARIGGESSCGTHTDGGSTAALFVAALRSLAVAGAVAAAWATAAPSLRLHPHGMMAAAIGALLSPCSTSDPILARVLFSHGSDQATFCVAAQCIDVRQMAMIRHRFGVAAMALAFAAGAAGSAAAAFVAR